MDDHTIMIGQLININNGLLISLFYVNIPPIGQLTKPWLANHNYKAVYTKLEGWFGLIDSLCFYTSFFLVFKI